MFTWGYWRFMKLFQLASMMLVGSVAVTLVACSSGGSSLLGEGRNLCPEKLNFIPDTLPPTQKSLNIDPAAGDIDPGEYTYIGADLYYVDNATPLRVDFHDVQQTDGTFQSGISCLRGANPDMKGLSFQTQGVNHMIIDRSGKSTIDSYDYNFNMDEQGLISNFKPDVGGQQKAPKDVYDGVKSAVQFVNMNTDANTVYEMRSNGTTERGTYQLIVRMLRKELTAPALSPADWFKTH
jgi:hypothetical protein